MYEVCYLVYDAGLKTVTHETKLWSHMKMADDKKKFYQRPNINILYFFTHSVDDGGSWYGLYTREKSEYIFFHFSHVVYTMTYILICCIYTCFYRSNYARQRLFFIYKLILMKNQLGKLLEKFLYAQNKLCLTCELLYR